MTEAQRIADQHRRAFDGDAWHGADVFALLEGVDAARAAQKPLAGAHSIWEITAHIRTWEEVALRRMRGEPTEPTPEQDWPPVEETDARAWKQTLTALRETHDELNRQIEALPDDRLYGKAAGKDYTLYVLLHGVVQHGLYHAGQIALLRKDPPRPS